MIRAKDAIATARGLLGTPYSEMDCIALIRAVIRRSPGGVSDYRCEGTNWLWDSVSNSGKYQHLIRRQEGISAAAESSSGSTSHLPQRGRFDAAAGMLAFKRSGEDVHHVGLVTGEGTVIHSSSAKGRVVETALDCSWHLLGVHRYIETANGEEQNAALVTDRGEQSQSPARNGAGTRSVTTLVNDADGYVMTISGDWRVAED